MRFRPPLPAVSAGLLAAFVGFASSFSVVLQGLAGAGASQAQAASGLIALSLAMGVCAIVLSYRHRMPISIAWSTPGAALLAGTGVPAGGFPAAVGAFLLAALLVVAAGLFRPLGRLVERIPSSIANAMLAGILFSLCLAPVKAIAAEPLAGLAIVATWVLVGRFRRLLAVPAAALVAIGTILATRGTGGIAAASLLPHPVFVVPSFDLATAIGLGLPLFLVTMASQNIPGLTVLRVNGYPAPASPLFATTGVFSAIAAPFGGHAVNLAAITAAICAGEEAGPDRAERWWAAAVAGGFYVVFGLFAGAATAFASLAPILIQAVAGLALIAALAGALQGAMALPEERTAAAATFLTAASGITVAGIGGPFWGLLAGLALHAIMPRAKAPASPAVEVPPPTNRALPGSL